MPYRHLHNSSSKEDNEPKCSKDKHDDCKCGPKKSKLFCTSDNGLFNFDFRTNVDQWQTLATLRICQEECSDVLHEVCGIISTNAFGLTSINIIQKFRIIDEIGKEICQRTFNFHEDVNSSPADRIIVDFPFSFKCCDEPRQCECNTTYRLQTAERGSTPRVLTRDVTWAAIVWENC